MRCVNTAVWSSLILLLTVVGCSPSFFTDGLDGPSTVSGNLLPISSGVSTSTVLSSGAAGCTEPTAYVCRVSDMSNCKEAALGSTPVASDGSYNFPMAELGLSMSFKEIRYAVVIGGCDESYARPITGSKNQDIDLATTLVSYVQTSNAAFKLSAVAPAELGTFLSSAVAQLSGSDLSALYVALKLNSALASRFQTLFGLAPLGLEQAAPKVLSLIRPTGSLNEGNVVSLAVSTSHWNPGYNTVYTWKLDDNSVLGHSTTLNYTLGPNTQGQRTITLYIGADNGSGGLDINRPVTSIPMSFAVANTTLPQAPGISLASPTRALSTDPVSTRSLIVAIDTGALKANCASFSSMALSEDGAQAPDVSEFTLSCSSVGSQNESYTLQSSGDGAKNVAVWARDSSGVISATPSTITVNLDTASPTVSITSAPAALLNSSTTSVAFAATDTSSIAGYECALDGGSYSACTSPKSYTGLGSGAHTISVRATDAASNVATAATAAFLVDLSAPTVTIGSSPTALIGTRSASFVFSGADETGGSGVASFECSMDGASFSACSSPATFNSLTDASHTFRVKAIDGAGNRSSTAASTTFSVDATAPTLSISSLTGPYTGGTANNAASVVSIQWTATDANTANTQSFILEYSIDNGMNWNSLGSKAANNGPLTSEAFSYSWTVPASTNTAQARVRVSFADLAGNLATPAVTPVFTVDSTKPLISSFILAGGSATTALPAVVTELDASDSGMGASGLVTKQIKEGTSIGSVWTSYMSAGTFFLSLTSGSKTVSSWVKDAAGNISDPVSTSISLDFGSPPVLEILTPTISQNFAPLDSIRIGWSCSSANGLADAPIESIQYSIDDGVSFVSPPIATDITNNVSVSEGYYDWTLPLGITTFRLLISCKSTAGVVTTKFSQPINSGGWSIFAGDPWYGLKNVNALIADVGGAGRGSVTGDGVGNIYYAKGAGIMKIDALTGYVKEWGGSATAAGCTATTGRRLDEHGYNRLSGQRLLGNNSTFTEVYLASLSCAKIFAVRASDATVLREWSIPAGMQLGQDAFLANQRFILAFGVSGLYLLDLSSSASSWNHIHGNGSNLATSPLSAGANALSVGTGTGNGTLLFATSDLKKIWIQGFGLARAYTIVDPEGDGAYVVGSVDAGWSNSWNGTNCVWTGFDSFVYCAGRWAGRTIARFNLDTQTWSSNVIVPNDSLAGFHSFGITRDRLLTHYSLSEIHSIATGTITDTSTHVRIAGQSQYSMGNGSDVTKVGFLAPINMSYSRESGRLVLIEQNNFGRLLQLSGSSVSQVSTISGTTNIGIGIFLKFKPNSTTFVTRSGCGQSQSYVNGDITNPGIAAQALLGTGANCGTPVAPNVYPIPDNVDAISNTQNYFSANSAFFSTSTPILYHSNGKIYFAGYNWSSDAFIYSANGTSIRQVAGKPGPSGYDSLDDGDLALNAKLYRVLKLQEIRAAGIFQGDLLAWDSDRVRLVTIASESANPRIYDLVSFATAPTYAAGSAIVDAYYDEDSEQICNTATDGPTCVESRDPNPGVGLRLGSGRMYYVAGNKIRRFSPSADLATATDTAYAFSGTSFSSGEARIELTPAGLLVLQPSKKRVLRVAPF